MEIVRLVTIHPALVHFTIGALPAIVVAYGVAARRRSERWTFAADVALGITAVLTLATAAFGLVSNAVLVWPDSLELWRWLHLGFGAASTVLLLALAGGRLLWPRPAGPSGGRTFLWALGTALIVGFTGWVGGEVLVYRSGMAVRAAGDGALAPPVWRPKTPKNLLDAMEQLRALWASAESTTAVMIVQEPRDRDLASVEGDAHRMTVLTRWIASEGAKTMPNASQPSEHHAEAGEHEGHTHPAGAPAHPDAGRPMTVGEHLALMARELAEKTLALEAAAHARDVVRTARFVGEIQSACAHCHDELRWHAPPQRQVLH